MSRKPGTATQSNSTAAEVASTTNSNATPPAAEDQKSDKPVAEKEAASPVDPIADTSPVEAGPARSLKGLVVRKQEDVAKDAEPLVLGGLTDPEKAKMELILTRNGAGIASITFADIWITAAAKRQADAYFSAQASGSTEGYELPPNSKRFVLQRQQQIRYTDPTTAKAYDITIPLMSASGIRIQWKEGDEVISHDGPLELLWEGYWSTLGSGIFKAEIENDQGELVVEILRRFELNDGFDITLHQRVVNHSGRPLDVQWQQYGPPNLLPDRARYLDRRRFRFGYEFSDEADPEQFADVIADGDMLLEYGDVIKDENFVLWPNDQSREDGFTLSWFASTSRYFAMAIHPLLSADGSGGRSLESVVGRIERTLYSVNGETLVETGLFSPLTAIPPAGQHDFSMGLYAGPLSTAVLDKEEPYISLNMGGMILYQISGFSICACCTFQWLADFLLSVLTFLADHVVFDWGLAIIVLVMIVRFLLHPITRMSQMNMQKFSRKMQKLKPELDRLKERCGDDKKKMQQEQMKLMREHGLNPFQMLGCLPMLLQMPIWIALYAGLYFNYSLRQEPAFWGFFQMFDGWPFLADLAAPDHFFYTFQEPHEFLFWHLSGINLLPILLGVFFFLQQKYLTPQNAAMTPEQETQQKMIRVMTVVAFPLFLYTAPSGLTLYIMTSSIVGTLEGRHIRKQVDRMDLDVKPIRAEASTVAGRAATAAEGPKAGRDPQSRAYSRMVERRQSKGKGRGGKGRGGKKRG
ncbi:MAG: YidC/Oxa1 family insertase periplasmic-domain containing protein [Phycisphaerales bacterium]|nr:YidC/Oxa1 family insertase periplasmic-domain containing protein [Phycisphaerales bacterium]